MAQAGVSGDEVAGKGRLPAFLEDRPLDAFDIAVALRPTGADEQVTCLDPFHSLFELVAAEL
jgi:hypothetical protein